MERLKEMDIEGNLRRRITEIQRNRQHGENRGEENRKLLDNKRSETTPLSPIFFNAFLSDLEKDMSKVQEEEVVIGWHRVATSEMRMKGKSWEDLGNM